MELVAALLKVLVPVAIFFVWVVRYENIVAEFKHYSIPNWARDLTGIVKLSFAAMILSNGPLLKIGAAGIVGLMLAALVTHLRVKNQPAKMLPAFALMLASLAILLVG
jgi:hypothetical protein